MGFSRQEYWNGLPFPPPGDLPNPRIEPASLSSPKRPCIGRQGLYHYYHLPCFILYSKAKFACHSRHSLALQGTPGTPRHSLDFLFSHYSPLSWKGHLFWMLVLEGLVGLHRTVQLQLLQHYWLGHRLGLLLCWTVSWWSSVILIWFSVSQKSMMRRIPQDTW